MSKVFTICLALVDDATGQPVAMRNARVFTSDLAAGKYLLDVKVKEIWEDLFRAMPVEGTA